MRVTTLVKRIGCLILTACMGIVFITGCKGSNSSSNTAIPKELTARESLALVTQNSTGLVQPDIGTQEMQKVLLDKYIKWRSGNHFDAAGNEIKDPGYVQAFQLPEPFQLPWESEGSTEGAVVLMVPNGTASELPGEYCVSTDEAMGYGMILAAQFGDWTLFNQLLRVDLYYANYNEERFIRTGNGWSPHLTSWAIPAKKGKDWFQTEYFKALPIEVQQEWRENGVQYNPLYLENTPIKESVIVGETNDVKNSGGSATDGEIDIAYALYLAASNYPGDKEVAKAYKHLARTRFEAIFSEIVDIYGFLSEQPKSSIFLPTGDYRVNYRDGQSYVNEALTRPCDWMNAEFRTYLLDTGDSRAKSLIEANYGYALQLADPNTGFVPDFAAFKTFGSEKRLVPAEMELTNEWQSDLFYMNSARYPFRMAMDYYHYGDKRGLESSERIVKYLINRYKFENPEDFENMPPAIHQLSGEADETGLWQNPVLNATFYAAMSMSGKKEYQSYVTMGWNHLAQRFDSRFNDWDDNGLKYDPTHSGYFQDTWALMSLLVMSGHWPAP